MTPQAFIAKWRTATLTERSAYQQQFLDLCELLEHPKPAESDPAGTDFTFERGASRSVGGLGWADVWKRNHFGWEYKGKGKDLKAAYRQLEQYREALENPPLLVVCDFHRFEVHTNFTGTIKDVHAFALEDIAKPETLDLLRKVFFEPLALKPGLTPEKLTEQAAEKFGQLADGMRVRGIAAPAAAHFLMKLIFCMFAEDIALLPDKLFSKLVTRAKKEPARLKKLLAELFDAMSTGGDFGVEAIHYFNGGLFADSDVIELTLQEIEHLIEVARTDWSNVEPSIFGTLFERTLDPAKRSQIGAHYTSRDDIITLLEPVVMAPLRREWAEVRSSCDALWADLQSAPTAAPRKTKARPTGKLKKIEDQLRAYQDRLTHVTVLDPACGSGNFLYVAIHLLLELEKEVTDYALAHEVHMLPAVRPTQLKGIEINEYAQQLAQVVIWIGYLQWKWQNGFPLNLHPVLEPIASITLMDAILDLSDPEHPTEPEWPEAEFIVGNPPFLGNRLLAKHFEPAYTRALYSVYQERLNGRPDICCYWFEKAKSAIRAGRSARAGLLATQGIRGGTNRNVLKSIKDSGDIFFAISDRPWVLDGANVHVSLIGFDRGIESVRSLDSTHVNVINANLTSGSDLGTASHIRSNEGISFQGAIKWGPFDIDENEAIQLLTVSGNPHRRPNSDVIFPYLNGQDITRRSHNAWIIDFGVGTSREDASKYHRPFELVHDRVPDARKESKQQQAISEWWLHWRPRPQIAAMMARFKRWIATPRVSKHRVFAWYSSPMYADSAIIVFGTDQDSFFGYLHSRVHEIWALAQGTQLREKESGFRYTPTTCFETFPFPTATKQQEKEIAAAAAELDRLRSNWLNPPEWTKSETLEFPGSIDGPWARFVHEPNNRGIGTVRYPRLVPRNEEHAQQLAKRTLTNLYNERPTWLDLAHRRLDEAVFAAYNWPPTLTNDQLLAHLLELNLQQSKT